MDAIIWSLATRFTLLPFDCQLNPVLMATPLISVIEFVGLFFLVGTLLFKTRNMFQNANTQKLRVNVNVPESTSEAVLPLILNNADLLIFKVLMEHGRLNWKTWQIKYQGERIYTSQTQTFVIGRLKIIPHRLQVVHAD